MEKELIAPSSFSNCTALTSKPLGDAQPPGLHPISLPKKIVLRQPLFLPFMGRQTMSNFHHLLSNLGTRGDGLYYIL